MAKVHDLTVLLIILMVESIGFMSAVIYGRIWLILFFTLFIVWASRLIFDI